jgi:hypothetical protein
MGPGTLFPQVNLGILIRIQPGTLRHLPEGQEMQCGRAGSHYQAIQFLFSNILYYLLLGGVGAGKHGGFCDRHAFLVLDGIPDALAIHAVRYIAAAIAYIYAYSPFIHF